MSAVAEILEATAIKARAAALGFDRCGIAPADPARHAEYFQRWLDAGQSGEMQWLAREPARRIDPTMVVPEARSIIVVGLNYWRPQPAGRGRVARYALGDDYHLLMQRKLETLAEEIRTQDHEARAYVDTGPVLEKPLAETAGLGWQGKSTMLIDTHLGPWLLLGEIITSLELEPDAPATDHCGTCERCMKACPTGAITGPYQLDARRCIAYLTIELKGSIPEEMRPLIGDRIYGCDECLEVCPWNRFAQTTSEPGFLTDTTAAGEGRDRLHELLEISPAEFKRRFARSPILRVKRRGLLRNVCVALGNIGTRDDLPALHRAQQHDEPLVREHAEWAVRQIEGRPATKARAQANEP